MAIDKKSADPEVSALWFRVMEILKGGTEAIRPRQELLRLMDLDTDVKAKEYEQAFLGLCAIGRLRPGRAMGALSRYRVNCERNGRTQEFETFLGIFRDYLHPLVLTPHGYSEKTFANMDSNNVAQEVRRAQELVAEIFGYECFINSGTLLGMVREGKFLAHDDDVDLGVLLKASSQERAAREWRFFIRKLQELNLIKDTMYVDEGILKLNISETVDLELFPAWASKDGKVSVYPYSADGFAIENLLPLKPTGPFDLLGPAVPEPILEVNYGPKWRVPDPFFTFRLGAKRAMFKDYLRVCKSPPPGPRTVITYGTFDLFHAGHVRLLERLSKLGERLIVGLSTDQFNAIKDKKAVCSYEERKQVLEACSFVDLVIPEDTWEQKRQDIETHEVDLFAMGDDWIGKFDDLEDLCDVTYLSRTEDISTTDLKTRVNDG